MFDKSCLEASVRSPAIAKLLSIVWAHGRQRYIIWAAVQYVSLLSMGDNPEARLLWITETMSECLIMVQLTCPFLCHTNQMSRDSGFPGHLCVCMFTLVGGKAIPRMDEWQRQDHRTRGRTWINYAPQHSDSPTTLDTRQRHSARRLQANFTNSSAFLTLIQQLVSHQASPAARTWILDSKMWSLA